MTAFKGNYHRSSHYRLSITITIALLISCGAVTHPIDCSRLGKGNYVWGCSRFYSMCLNGVELPMLCSPNLVLNPENNQCLSPNETSVCKLVETKLYKARDPVTCTDREDGLHELMEGICSNIYINCEAGRKREMECPQGLVFNQAAGACEHAYNCKNKHGEGLIVIDQHHPQQQEPTGRIDEGGAQTGKSATPELVPDLPTPLAITADEENIPLVKSATSCGSTPLYKEDCPEETNQFYWTCELAKERKGEWFRGLKHQCTRYTQPRWEAFIEKHNRGGSYDVWKIAKNNMVAITLLITVLGSITIVTIVMCCRKKGK